MIAECMNCGAPLDVGQQVTFVKCRYCEKNNRVRSMRTVAMERPVDWKPPPRWTPPEAAEAESVELTYGESRAFPWKLVGLVLTVALAGGAFYYLTSGDAFSASVRGLGGAPAPAPAPAPPPPVWDGLEPFSCSEHEQVKLEGVTADLPNRTAITISGHCELTVRHSQITGWVGVTITDHGRLLLEGSTLEATGAALAVTGHGRAEVADSELSSHGIAVEGTRHAHLVFTGGSVTGTPRALGRRARPRSEVRGAEIHNVPRESSGHHRPHRRGGGRAHGGAEADPSAAAHADHPRDPDDQAVRAPAQSRVRCEQSCKQDHDHCQSLSRTAEHRAVCTRYLPSCHGRCAEALSRSEAEADGCRRQCWGRYGHCLEQHPADTGADDDERFACYERHMNCALHCS